MIAIYPMNPRCLGCGQIFIGDEVEQLRAEVARHDCPARPYMVRTNDWFGVPKLFGYNHRAYFVQPSTEPDPLVVTYCNSVIEMRLCEPADPDRNECATCIDQHEAISNGEKRNHFHEAI